MKKSKKGEKRIKILMVEDDKFLRDLAAKKLKKMGYQLECCADGESALKILEKQKPDLILLDIILPGIDGFEILKNLKSNNKTKNIPIILLSNLGQKSDIDRGINMGADDYLIKAHFTLDEIVDKIKRFIKRK